MIDIFYKLKSEPLLISKHVIKLNTFEYSYPVLQVSLDCPFFISPSVFSDVYLQCIGFY